MQDEKVLLLMVGCRGTGLLYICDLCYATQDSAKTDLGTFKICRILEETKQIADHFNPNTLAQAQLSAVAKVSKLTQC